MTIVTAGDLTRLLTANLVALLVALGFSSVASAEIDPALTADETSQATIYLTDGSVIVGVVKGIRDDALTVDTAFSDGLSIDVALVKSFKWLQETELMLNDDRVVMVPSLKVADGEIELEGKSIALAEVAVMNPEDWEEGKGYKWEGDTSAALALNRGNTNTDEVDLALNTRLVSTRDRYTFNAAIEQDDNYTRDAAGDLSDPIPVADNWKVLGKYDYFLVGDRNYLGVNGSLDADALAGIDLRTYFGPYFGRKLLDDDVWQLDGELGLAYVDTDYSDEVPEEDNSYTGLNWNFTGETSILGGDSRIYLRHVGILDVADSDQLILRNTLGLAFPLLYGLEAAAEVSYDYDGTASVDREAVDQVYKFRIGYAW